MDNFIYSRNMLFAVITGPNYDKAKQQILQANTHASGLELRLDYFEKLDLKEIGSLLKLTALPVLLTLKKNASWIKKLSTLGCAFMDLEYDLSPQLFQTVDESQILCSYHHFEETPADLEKIFSKMRKQKAHAYKLATMAHSAIDALRMLNFVKTKTAGGHRLSGICMGEEGQITRILGPIVGNFIDYACLEEANSTAPGQLTLSELAEIYHYPHLNPQTEIYGLIGDPITQSPSYITHNAFFRKHGLNAVYVRMRVKPEELNTFFSLAKQLGIRGLSVTIPLKELVLPFLDEIDPMAQEIGAVNTIVFEKGKLKGFNTDATGALDAIESKRSVNGKKIVLLGAGGSAKAIAYEAKKRGAELVVLARKPGRANSFTQKFGCSLKTFEEMPHLFKEGYDMLINCTPETVPVDPKYLLKNSLFMDINTLHRNTSLLNEAENKQCHIVYGYEMFMNQASGQFALWFKDRKLQNFELDPTFFLK